MSTLEGLVLNWAGIPIHQRNWNMPKYEFSCLVVHCISSWNPKQVSIPNPIWMTNFGIAYSHEYKDYAQNKICILTTKHKFLTVATICNNQLWSLTWLRTWNLELYTFLFEIFKPGGGTWITFQRSHLTRGKIIWSRFVQRVKFSRMLFITTMMSMVWSLKTLAFLESQVFHRIVSIMKTRPLSPVATASEQGQP